MTRLLLTVIACALLAGQAAAQTFVATAGLVAEGEGRWEDALTTYRRELERQPSATELWLRIADIQARLGRPQETIAALERAAQTNLSDDSISSRLSQAYAAAGHATAAQRALEAALAVRPDSDEYLRAHATVATWAGDYDAASSSYRKLREGHPTESDLTLALARVNVWAGHTDAATRLYREYLATPDASADVWLELARAEGWRGNFAGALAPLREYRTRVGETDAYDRELAATLARGGRPRQALRYLEPILAQSPDDYELALSRTIALTGIGRRGDANITLIVADALQPDRAETVAAANVLRSLLGSNAGPTTDVYSDSDGLRTIRIAPRFDVGFDSDTRVQGGYEHIGLQARAGSGLEQVGGEKSAAVSHGWAGLTQRIGRLTVAGTLGQARLESHDLVTYSGSMRVAPSDTFAFSLERRSTFAGDLTAYRRAWLEPAHSSRPNRMDAGHPICCRGRRVVRESCRMATSDGKCSSLLAPLLRAPSISISTSASWPTASAPRAICRTATTIHASTSITRSVIAPYWKISENVGINVSAGLGGQRDDASTAFRFGGNASAEATFGIYERWLLKVHGSTTTNRRLESGAFRGYSSGLVLLRRF